MPRLCCLMGLAMACRLSSAAVAAEPRLPGPQLQPKSGHVHSCSISRADFRNQPGIAGHDQPEDQGLQEALSGFWDSCNHIGLSGHHDQSEVSLSTFKTFFRNFQAGLNMKHIPVVHG